MANTRVQAQTLLTQAEMALYDDSRINGLRALSATELTRRVERTRKLRDKARDQLQRQRLASRGRTGSKRGVSGNANERSKAKAELLADILQRFEAQLKLAGRKSSVTAVKKPARTAAKTKASPPLAKKVVTRKLAKKTSSAVTVTTAAKKKASPPSKTVSPAVAKKTKASKKTTPSTRASFEVSHISPEQALANTRALLQSKRAHDRQPQPWQRLDSHHLHMPHAVSPSPSAAARATQLHAAESRMPAIQGSISTQDRHSQGKRDSRR